MSLYVGAGLPSYLPRAQYVRSLACLCYLSAVEAAVFPPERLLLRFGSAVPTEPHSVETRLCWGFIIKGDRYNLGRRL